MKNFLKKIGGSQNFLNDILYSSNLNFKSVCPKEIPWRETKSNLLNSLYLCVYDDEHFGNYLITK